MGNGITVGRQRLPEPSFKLGLAKTLTQNAREPGKVVYRELVPNRGEIDTGPRCHVSQELGPIRETRRLAHSGTEEHGDASLTHRLAERVCRRYLLLSQVWPVAGDPPALKRCIVGAPQAGDGNVGAGSGRPESLVEHRPEGFAAHGPEAALSDTHDWHGEKRACSAVPRSPALLRDVRRKGRQTLPETVPKPVEVGGSFRRPNVHEADDLVRDPPRAADPWRDRIECRDVRRSEATPIRFHHAIAIRRHDDGVACQLRQISVNHEDMPK